VKIRRDEAGMLTERELTRYRRQIIIPDWGEEGQERLRSARVVVAGVGGLGSAALSYLVMAGVGRIRVIDDDKVDLSNLNRQVLHGQADIGRPKVESAADRLRELNPDVSLEIIGESISRDNIFNLIEGMPIVDALDNLESRLLLNQAFLKGKEPLFHGAVYGFEGRATTLIPGRTPCLNCLYQGSVPGEVPVLGTTPGIIGCIQATELIKYVLGVGRLLQGRLLTYDGFEMSFREFNLSQDPGCEVCR